MSARHGSAPPAQGRPRATSVVGVWALCIAVAAVALALGRGRFTTNDDVLIRSIASGALGGRPDPHLVFVSVVLGAPLALLYRLTDAVPWYALLLTGSAVVAVGAVAASVRRARVGERWIVAVVLLVPLTVVVTLQTFTASAMLVAACGAALHDEALHRADGRRLSVAAGVLIVLGASLRFDAALVAVGLCEVVLVLGDRAVWSRRHVTFGAAVAVAVLVARGIDVTSYSIGHGWHAFWELNVPRSQLHSTPRLDDSPQLARAIARAGWTVNDLQLFRTWLHTDRSTFSVDALRTLLAGTDGRSAAGSRRRLFLDQVYRPYRAWAWWAVGAVVHALVVARRAALGVVVAVVTWAALGTYLVIHQRFPARLAVPALAAAVVAAAVVARARSSTAAPWALLLVACTMVPGVLLVRSNAERARRDGARLREQVAAMDGFGPDARFVVVGSTVDLEGTSSLRADVLDMRRSLVLSWTNLSPAYDRQLARLGIDEPIHAAARRDDVHLVVPADAADAYLAPLNAWLVEQRYDGPPLRIEREVAGLAFLS